MNMKWLGSATFSRFLDASNSYIYVDLSWDEYTSSELLEVKVLYCTNIKKKEIRKRWNYYFMVRNIC